MSTEFSSLASQEYFNKKWINPSSLAIAASIGLHGVVLGLVWPNLSSWSQDESTAVEAPVDVIELTAAEQARLPDLEPKPINLEDFANFGNLPDNNPSSLGLPPLASTLPPPLSSLPPITALPPLAFNNRIPIAPSLPRAIPYRRIPSPPRPNLPAPPPLSSSQTLRQNLKFDPPRPLIGPDIIKRKPDPKLPGEEGSTVEASDTQPLAPPIPPQLQAALQRNDANTTDNEANNNSLAWMQKTGKSVKKSQSVGLSGNYPKAACLNKLNGAAVYGVTVNAQGRAVSAPYLIRSSGYGIFNQQAVQDIRSHTFPAGAGSYYATVSYRYNPKACPNIQSSPQTPAIQETSNPPTQQTPLLTPQKQPAASPDLPTAAGNQAPSTTTLPETTGNTPTVGQPSGNQPEPAAASPNQPRQILPNRQPTVGPVLPEANENQPNTPQQSEGVTNPQISPTQKQPIITNPQQPQPSASPNIPTTPEQKPPVSQPSATPTNRGTKPAAPEATQTKPIPEVARPKPTPEATQPKPPTPTPVKPRTTQGSPASSPTPAKTQTRHSQPQPSAPSQPAPVRTNPPPTTKKAPAPNPNQPEAKKKTPEPTPTASTTSPTIENKR